MTKQRLKPLLLPCGMAFILVYGALCMTPASGEPHKGGGAQQAVAVRVASAVEQDLPRLIRAVGTVVPNQTVGVRARLDSQIMEVKFHDGDTVKKGDVLFVLDDRSLKVQRVQTQASLDRDNAQLDNAKRQYDRLAQLGKQGYASHTDQDNAQAAQKAAAAAVGADQAALENIDVQLGYTVITAPIEGRTGTINVTEGNTVKANDTNPLVTINQIKPILMQASLPQDSFDGVRAALQAGKAPATAARNGSAETAKGVLKYIDNTIDQATGTYVARASFENADEHLWPGMIGNLTIETGTFGKAVTVPEVAIQHAGDADFVFVIEGGKARKQTVKLTQIQEGLAVVAEGVKPGDQVAVDGMMMLQDGSAVTIAAEKQAEAK